MLPSLTYWVLYCVKVVHLNSQLFCLCICRIGLIVAISFSVLSSACVLSFVLPSKLLEIICFKFRIVWIRMPCKECLLWDWFLLSGCLNSFIFPFAVINKSLQKQDMFPVLGYLCQHSGNRSVLYQRYIFSGNLEILSLSQRQ